MSDVFTANISQMPELVLLTIFDNLPVDDLLNIEHVCSRWAGLSKEAFGRRESLTLEVTTMMEESSEDDEVNRGSQWKPYVTSRPHPLDGMSAITLPSSATEHFGDRHRLTLSKLTRTVVDDLAKKLPRLTSLRVIFEEVHPDQVGPLIRLLAAYRGLLLAFRFYSNFALPVEADLQPFPMSSLLVRHKLAALFGAASRLGPQLTTLTLENGNPIVYHTGEALHSISLPEAVAGSQLTTLEVSTGHSVTLLMQALSQVATGGDQLTAISLANPMDFVALAGFLGNANLRPVAGKFRHLAILLDKDVLGCDLLKTFTQLFSPTLASLELHLTYNFTWCLGLVCHWLFHFLALTRLHLHLVLPESLSCAYARRRGVRYPLFRQIRPPQAYTQLKALTLSVAHHDHSQLADTIDLAGAFPALSSLTISVLNCVCRLCGYEVAAGNGRLVVSSEAVVGKCLEGLVAPLINSGRFTQLATLKVISHPTGVVRYWRAKQQQQQQM